MNAFDIIGHASIPSFSPIPHKNVPAGRKRSRFMEKNIIVQLNQKFEDASQRKDGLEYWMARDLQVLLDYSEWRNFLLVVEKAKTACLKSKQHIADHFVDINKMIPMPKGASKTIDDN